MRWRSAVGKESWLEMGRPQMELVDELTEFMAYCCAVRKNKEGTMSGKLVAVNFYYEH